MENTSNEKTLEEKLGLEKTRLKRPIRETPREKDVKNYQK